MSDDELPQTWRTETTVREYDRDGTLTSETVTAVTRSEKPKDDLPTGMYL